MTRVPCVYPWQALVAERTARSASDAELRHVRATLDAEVAARSGFETHDKALRRSQTSVESALGRCQTQLAESQALVVETHERFIRADAAARYWAQRATEAQGQARDALCESHEARAAQAALQKCLIRENTHSLSEEAGYRLDAVVQIAPTHPAVTVFGGARHPSKATSKVMLNHFRERDT